ncbi:MAG: NADH-quinone oxidoreductase subunit J [Bacillota bacterium]|nr:NADH-quinone oxidoreductase subunit J [Bacillota bacterium]
MTAVFWFLAGVTVLAAAGVMALPNVFHASLCFALSFFALAGVYLTLGAEFLAAIQILIYTGAIAVIIAFAVMLTPPAIGHSNLSNRQRLWAGAVALLALGLLAGGLVPVRWPEPGPLRATSAASLGELMLTRYVVPFEVAGFILLVALIAAITVAKGALKP